VQIQGLRYAKAMTNDNGAVTGYSGCITDWFAFRAPENTVDVEHTIAVDIWSLGAMLYFLLTGLSPFRGKGRELVNLKATGIIEYDLFNCSDSARNLIDNMLKVDTQERFTIDQVLEHEWMNFPDEVLSISDLSLAQDILTDWVNFPRAPSYNYSFDSRYSQ
jgi:serine/threonine protein kinase